MKKEQLYETIGEIDDKYVDDAHKITKKKARNTWIKWSAIAACICFIVVGAFTILPNNNDEIVDDNIATSTVADVAPMIFINNILYKQNVKQISYAEMTSDFIYLGKIEEDITSNQSTSNDGVPKENYQANSPIVGANVYQYGDNIVVEINSKYWLYEVLETENDNNGWDSLTEEEKMQLDPSYNP